MDDYLDFEHGYSGQELEVGFSLLFQENHYHNSINDITNEGELFGEDVDGFLIVDEENI